MTVYADQIMVPLSQGSGVCAFNPDGDQATVVVATYEADGEVDQWLHDENPYVRAAAHARILEWARQAHAATEA